MKNLTKFLLGVGVGTLSLYYIIDKLVKEDEFSDTTKKNLEGVVSNAKNISQTVKRAYTSIEENQEFIDSKKAIGDNVKQICNNSISLVKDASNDVYSYFKDKFTKDDSLEDSNSNEMN